MNLKRLAPWIALVFTMVMLVWGAASIELRELFKLRHLLASDSGSRVVELGVSPSFRLVGPEDYLTSDEIQITLDEFEDERNQVLELLGRPEFTKLVTVRLYPGGGAAAGRVPRPDRIDLAGFKAGSDAFVHELTHLVLFEYSRSFIREGLAEFVQSRVDPMTPTTPYTRSWHLYMWQRPADAALHAFIGGESSLFPLVELERKSILGERRGDVIQQQYLQAWSFSEYLIDEYGIDKFLEVYESPNWERVYGASLESLEEDWLDAIRPAHLLLGGVMTLGGLVFLSLLHLALQHGRRWLPALIIGGLAMLTWSIFFAFLAMIPALILVMIVTLIVGRWYPSQAVRLLWILGISCLLLLALIPAVIGVF